MVKHNLIILILLSSILTVWNCTSKSENQEELPYLGFKQAEEKTVDGKTVTDTLYHTIAPFSFTDQDGATITNSDVKGKVYVADFFFTSCPTICPIMKTQMLRVYDAFKDNPDFQILSHSIDPTHDTVAVLKDYSVKLGIEDASTWHFLTGDQEKIFEIGQTSYLATAMEDKNEPGGFLHSGAFILIDREGHIRGVYDGTKEDQVDELMKDIPKLLHNAKEQS
ncbi:SCO family protein [Echinicola strongylocentroti]|uniref:SCO family protein n=1 Tax=Echinicola strongylocentroti TaxID=1795355 RepID=A0A2Z4IQ87_9BACT|nr:SCO family protein [Echinicola strongylocentroti]AWW33085.1 SCO family protein [Echinicola strongylocentroti]